MSLRHLAVPLAACLCLAACDVVQSGENGLLAFTWLEVERGVPVDFDTPIAVGMTATLRVSRGPEASLDGPGPEVTDATTSAGEVLEVISVTTDTVTVRARAAGEAVLTLTTTYGEDRIAARAADVVTVSVYGPGFLVPEAPTPLGVVGGRMYLPVAMRDAAASAVIGTGALPLTLSAEPAGAVELESEVARGLVAPVFLQEGSITLSPAAGDSFTTTIVPRSAIRDLELRGLESQTTAVAGTRTTTILRGLTDDLRRVAGLEGAVLVEFNEAVCALEATPVLGDGGYEVRFEAPGTCTITVAVPGETGFSESWTVEVAAAP